MSAEANRQLDDCGGCAGVAIATPLALLNRPGLSAIAYRVGTHAEFLQSMLAGLTSAARPVLGKLNTRDSDDFTIALLDAWATVADVLTFYQERIANEGTLRTATERFSVLELARLIGYELRPGVAASTLLAFTLESAPGSPELLTLSAPIKVSSLPGPGEKPQIYESVEAIEARVAWNVLKPRLTEPQRLGMDTKELWLAGTTTNLTAGDALLIVGAERAGDAGSERWDFRRLKSVEPDLAAGRTRVSWEDGLGWRRFGQRRWIFPAESAQEVHVFRQKASLFGANAPDWRVMPNLLKNDYLGRRERGKPPKRKEWPGFLISEVSGADTIHLDALYPTIVPRSWVVLSTPQYEELYAVVAADEDARAAFTLQSKSTRLRLSGENLTEKFDDQIRQTVVYAQNQRLTLSERPLDGWTGSGARPPSWYVEGNTILLDRALTDVLPVGRRLIVSGFDASSSAPRVEVATLLEQVPQDGLTALRLSESLAGRYHRETVQIRANVALASHGETVASEVLGSGDASRPHQRFDLRQGPVTHVPAANESGSETTLEVRVDGVRWHEVTTLHEQGPRERVYVSRTDDAGTTRVQFGDGHQGVRLPTGRDNVVASYRKGIGKEGEVRADQLSLLMTRPLGLKAVTNPLPGTGAQDRQSLEDARQNAPPTVITLGRVVSLSDYEDYARAFAGIGKASAAWVWTGAARGVLLTVAGLDGKPVLRADTTYTALRDAIRQASDPSVPFHIASYRAASFSLDAELLCQPDHLPERVRTAAEAALAKRFSFAARAFGAAVTLGEVVAVLQNVPGVVMVDLNRMTRAPAIALPAGWPVDTLPARMPRPGESVAGLTPVQLEAKAAELLTIALPVSGVRVAVQA